ncbi:hypothetical protein CBS101457_001276 [Exobasidium rhododendri]|nr:hypothetical protein CBS101457_001276 [Exobasidium rhododendri]
MSARSKSTVYIGGIPPQCNESIIHSYFQPFGEIMEVQLPKNNQQEGMNRGFGFVMFASDNEAESAIDNMHLNEVEGRIVTVNLAKPLKNATGDNRKPIWESEEWIQQHGKGEGEGMDDGPMIAQAAAV